MIKYLWGLALWSTVMSSQTGFAAEYNGKNIDGKKLAATVYYQETGGTFNVQVEFQGNQAILYFVNGSQQILQIQEIVISNPHQIYGWGRSLSLNIYGIFNIGLVEIRREIGESFTARHLEGFWTINLDENALKSLE
jgi:hypothetical protein